MIMKKCVFFILPALLLVLESCSQPPSDEVIKAKIAKRILESGVYVNPKVLYIEVIERGEFYQKTGNWPVKVKYQVEARGRPWTPAIVSFNFFKDDSGEWQFR